MNLKEFCLENGIPLEKLGDIGEVSDGFHTFNSLYQQRLILFATLVNTFPTLAWKSHKHSDGEAPFGGGWFIVGITTPKGQYTYHYKDKDWGLFCCKEVELAPEWDGHTDADVERVLSLTHEPADWADREVTLACKVERDSANTSDESDYGCGCYESALRAYRSLCRDGHSGMSIQITKGILNRLIDGKCLTPIEDTPDIWEKVDFGKDEESEHFQCKRMSSLFKDIASDGTVTYSDVNRVTVVNVDNPENAYQNGFTTRLVDKIFPIAMPYFPTAKKFKVVRDEFLVDPKNCDYDTVAFLYIITPSGQKIELNRYFKEVDHKLVPIEKDEFDALKEKRVDKK